MCASSHSSQITDPGLMDLIRRKMKFNLPYAGVFLKKNPNEIQVIKDIPDAASDAAIDAILGDDKSSKFVLVGLFWDLTVVGSIFMQ
ncbi:unnamed protein product [Dibothriocephalus latus]|uniref:Uncharacterized protein n=1 Tax=Dibothriocephalus latus TaxID=60516 RepID=A0A3P7Q4N4_DIBLA|nr:unnamed protein product [Dibothriocephalus latus]